MVIQIAFGIFFGFLFLGIFIFLVLGFAWFVIKKQEDLPSFIDKPEKKKRKTNVQDWWDNYDDEDY